jgi:hypothetical protein
VPLFFKNTLIWWGFLKIVRKSGKWEFGYLSLTMHRWYKEGLLRKDKESPLPENMDLFGESFGLPFFYGNSITEREKNDVSIYFNLDDGLMGAPINYWFDLSFEECPSGKRAWNKT